MKRTLSVIISLIIILTLSGCSGNVSNVSIIEAKSDIYSNIDIKAAEQTVLNYFKKEFKGCNLKELQYIGDKENNDYKDTAIRHNASEVIVFVSSFKVDASGGDGSLNPNSTYTGFKWILIRNQNGEWEHADHGY